MSNEAIGLGFMPVDTASTPKEVDIESKYREEILSSGITEEGAIEALAEFDASIEMFVDIMKREKAVLAEMIANGELKKKEPPKELEDKYEVLYVAKNLLLVEKDYAAGFVNLSSVLLSYLNDAISSNSIALLGAPEVKEELLTALLDYLHFRFGGDRDSFFSSPEYRAERMACVGSDSLIYNDLIKTIEEAQDSFLASIISSNTPGPSRS